LKIFAQIKNGIIFAPLLKKAPAEIAQLVEHDLAKVGVASSSLVFRSTIADSFKTIGNFFIIQ
jgi:hypothetical protein